MSRPELTGSVSNFYNDTEARNMILWDGLTKEGGMDTKEGRIISEGDSDSRMQQ